MSAGHVKTEGAIARSVDNAPGVVDDARRTDPGHKNKKNKDKKNKNKEIKWNPVPFASVVHGVVERIYYALNEFLRSLVLISLSYHTLMLPYTAYLR